MFPSHGGMSWKLHLHCKPSNSKSHQAHSLRFQISSRFYNVHYFQSHRACFYKPHLQNHPSIPSHTPPSLPEKNKRKKRRIEALFPNFATSQTIQQALNPMSSLAMISQNISRKFTSSTLRNQIIIPSSPDLHKRSQLLLTSWMVITNYRNQHSISTYILIYLVFYFRTSKKFH